MTGMTMKSHAAAIDRYVRTGDHDFLHSSWSGSLVERSEEATRELKCALLDAVESRLRGCEARTPTQGVAFRALTRARVQPMIRGLFASKEQDAVLAMAERSVVILTPDRFGPVITACSWLRTAWNLANMYLGSLGGALLSADAPRLLGLSEGTTCFVSLAYFTNADRFSDWLVHEVAHLFHNVKRGAVGLHQTRRREWLLDVGFQRRETFAYACEYYGRVLALGRGPADRRALVEELADGPLPTDRVDADDLLDILRGAVWARNGWKRILARCAGTLDAGDAP